MAWQNFCSFCQEYPILHWPRILPPPQWKVAQHLVLEFWLPMNTPSPPPKKLKFGQKLALWVLTTQEYPPPPQNWNLARSWHFEFWQPKNTPPTPTQSVAVGSVWRLIAVSPKDTVLVFHFMQKINPFDIVSNWKLFSETCFVQHLLCGTFPL